MISSDKIKFKEVLISMKYQKKVSYFKITSVINWVLMIGTWLCAIVHQEKID